MQQQRNQHRYKLDMDESLRHTAKGRKPHSKGDVELDSTSVTFYMMQTCRDIKQISDCQEWGGYKGGYQGHERFGRSDQSKRMKLNINPSFSLPFIKIE